MYNWEILGSNLEPVNGFFVDIFRHTMRSLMIPYHSEQAIAVTIPPFSALCLELPSVVKYRTYRNAEEGKIVTARRGGGTVPHFL